LEKERAEAGREEDGVALRDGRYEEETDWGACRDVGWSVDGGGTGSAGGGEYVSDLFG